MRFYKGTSIFRIIKIITLIVILMILYLFIFDSGNDNDQIQLTRLVYKMECMANQCHDKELRDLLIHTSQKYKYIRSLNVRIINFGNFNIAGLNIPFIPGLTIDRWCWDNFDDCVLIGLLLHEVMHEHWPYLGHKSYETFSSD